MRFIAEWHDANGTVTPLASNGPALTDDPDDAPTDPLIAVLVTLERMSADFPRATTAVRRLIDANPDACEIIAWLAYKETGLR